MDQPSLPLRPMRLANQRKPHAKLTSSQVIEALKKKHPPGIEWVFLTEVAFATGFQRGSDNHIDVMAFNCWPSSGLGRYAYEIKVSREDFKRELKNPDKRKRAVEHSNYFFFAAPAGLIDPADIPEEAGLVEVSQELSPKIVVEAPRRDDPKVTMAFFLAALRNAQGLTLARKDAYRDFRYQMWCALNNFPKEVFASLAAWDKAWDEAGLTMQDYNGVRWDPKVLRRSANGPTA